MRRFLERVLPASWIAAIREETVSWRVECPCGHSQDLWSYGGIRYRAAGNPRIRGRCAGCGEVRWMTLRRDA